MLSLTHVPDFISFFMRDYVWREKTKEKNIYLTFDDGPNPDVTPLVLDLLDIYHAKATFFCVGENVLKYPDLYREILKRGHRTGNHTFNHLKGRKNCSLEHYVKNVEKAAELIDSNLFRPPYGSLTYRQRKRIVADYRIIMYDILTEDYNKNVEVDTIVKNIKKYSRKGSIVLFHDSPKAKDNLLGALPTAMEFWKGEGYRFLSL